MRIEMKYEDNGKLSTFTIIPNKGEDTLTALEFFEKFTRSELYDLKDMIDEYIGLFIDNEDYD